MIKFRIRRNLKYPGQYLIWTVARDILNIIATNFLGIQSSISYCPFMFLGEFIAGGIIHLYLRKIDSQKSESKDQYFMSIKLIKTEENDTDYFIPVDNKIKIIFLIFIASFLDWIIFFIDEGVIGKIKRLSFSISMRLYGFATIFASFTYIYTLKLPLYKHHKLSLFVIGICLIVIIVSEYFFQVRDITLSYINFTYALLLIIVSQLFVAIQDSIEKYLFEYNYLNPFVVLMYEGLFGFVLSFLFFFHHDYFRDIKNIFKNKKTGEIILFLFVLIVYTALSGLKNIFRVVTIKIFSPMASILSYYIINPLYFPYYCIALKDFKDENDKINIPYLLLNIIISIIISFFGCVYNEFIILFCCHLERDTHSQISERAITSLETELVKVDDEENEGNNIYLNDFDSMANNN